MNNNKTSVLVINCDCLLVNSSANLCHLSYLKGLVDTGCDVTLISKSKDGYRIDPDLAYPDGVKCCLYSGATLYERLSAAKRRRQDISSVSTKTNVAAADQTKTSFIRALKKKFRSLYKKGDLHHNFLKKARRFYSDELYDYVISLSTPITSHKFAYELISSGKVKCRHWIQIWEDPWYDDVFGFNRKDGIYQSEKRILDTAEKVCYVSPITLEKQKQLFPDAADKMFWQPVPSYDNGVSLARTDHEGLTFGYFGNYYPESRNLKPFYEAAKAAEINVSICGNPSGLLESTEKIEIHPRMGVKELRRIEGKTDVLVFLCNRAGGQIPGKLYQYSETDRIILFILDGTDEEQKAIQDFFAPLDRYVFCVNSAESIQTAIERIRTGDLAGVLNKPTKRFASGDIVKRILAMR